MNKIFLSWGFMMLFHGMYGQQTIHINEVLADNKTSISDHDGDFSDWIELYNPNDHAVSLINWQIGDNDHLWTFPDVEMEAYSYLLLYASDKNKVINEEMHTNFKLTSEGEKIQLWNASNELIDQIDYPALEEDFSYGRSFAHDKTWAIYKKPSPALANDTGEIFHNFSSQLFFSLPAGFYQQDIEVSLQNTNPTAKIYYTLDGSIPNEDDFLYEGAIPFRLHEPPNAKISYIPTAEDWVKPSGVVQTHYVLRARAFLDHQPDSPVVSTSYFLHPEGAHRYSLPIVSLMTEADHFFDAKMGIYVEGDSTNFYKSGQAWERPVAVDFFDENGNLLLSQDAGIRVGGAKTRLEAQKTVRLYAREKYGKPTFNYPFWGEDYGDDIKRINLRTMDVTVWSQAAIMDDFVHQVIDGEVNTDYVRRKFAIVFLNGEYWGIHSMREHNNEHFLARKYGIDDDDIRFYNGGEAYTRTAPNYTNLMNNLRTYRLADPLDFAKLEAQLDVEQFTDYIITNLAVANIDWPQNNMEFWDAPTFDGKLRFVINDLDASLQVYNDDRLSLFFEQERRTFDLERREWSLFILQKLFENSAYRLYFNQRMTALLNTTFAPPRTIEIWGSLVAELRPEIEEHIRRWHFPESVSKWEKAVQKAEHFLLQRPNYLMQSTFDHLGFPVKVFPNPVVDELMVEMLLWEQETLVFELYNITGQMVLQEDKTLEEGHQKVNVKIPQTLSTGMYILKIKQGGQWYSAKIFKR